jgi:3'-5' exoribonuclease 1
VYFVIDLEATCWERKKVKDNNEIIEIGIVACSDNGIVLDTYQTFVRPVISPNLSRFCKELTKIKQEWVDAAQPLRVAIPEIQRWARGKFKIESSECPWVAFGNWDELCLSRDCERHELRSPFGRFINLKDLYAAFSGCDHCGLKEALKAEKLVWEGKSHRALDDAVNAAKLAKFLVLENVLSGRIEEPPASSS